MAGREAELKSLAESLAEVMATIFEKQGGVKFSGKPGIERRDIVEWNKKMTITGMEKFNSSTYISFVQYYLNDQDKEKQNVLGALVLFIAESQLPTFVSKLGYPKVDDENIEEMVGGCGKICADLAKTFQEKLASLGYPPLPMSDVKSYRNSVPQGVGFCYKEYDKFEINFSMENRKVLCAELTMGVMPRSR